MHAIQLQAKVARLRFTFLTLPHPPSLPLSPFSGPPPLLCRGACVQVHWYPLPTAVPHSDKVLVVSDSHLKLPLQC